MSLLALGSALLFGGFTGLIFGLAGVGEGIVMVPSFYFFFAIVFFPAGARLIVGNISEALGIS